MKTFLHPVKRLLFTFGLVSLIVYCSHGQSISGYIRDENNNPVPFANIFYWKISFDIIDTWKRDWSY
ncbi:MAG: hypothetical protein WD824_08400 [Cyclobacteriaceae bacterium]